MATLSQLRGALATACTSSTAQMYRARPKDPKFPCRVIGWPEEMDVRPVQDGDSRDTVIPVWVAAEWLDDESSDDLLSALLEETVTALLAAHTLGGVADDIDVRPATNFGQELTADDRTIIWAAIPVAIYS